MTLLYYRPLQNVDAEKLQSIIETEFPEENIEVYYTTEDLSERLRQLVRVNCAAIILAEDIYDLQSLFDLRNLLKDIRIILVLPDRTEEIISMGHKLHPRFLSYIDSDFNDVAGVLKKIIRLMEKNIHGNNIIDVTLN